MTTAAPARQVGLAALERAENFPVALRLLPASVRSHLAAVYDVARTLDDLGDTGPREQRATRVKEFGEDLARVWTGDPQHPALRRLGPTVRACALPRQPFDDLVRANLEDQRVTAYASWWQLRDYCRLSADPVGRLVLAVFGVRADGVTTRRSDAVCTGLQLVEHWQDVGEDRRAGRVYLPAEDLAAYDVQPADLDAPTASPALRALIAFETDRAAALLDEGVPLVRDLHGWARLAVAGYVAGGRAAVRALRRAEHDVLPTGPRTRRQDVLRELAVLLGGALVPRRGVHR